MSVSNIFTADLGKAVAYLVLACAFILFLVFVSRGRRIDELTVDEAEFGIGSNKVKIKPNNTDRQVAYAIWVEMSTRKIGVPIDLENDVIVEVYDSWYGFFQVTRSLLSSIPVSKVSNASTQKIIHLTFDLLNKGLRPHLTRWQARFRRWYDHENGKDENLLVDPQDIQKNFPLYDDLAEDMVEININLIRYKDKLEELIR